jgi:hypothetical protein
VYLDGKRLPNWSSCVSNNFIPNYQANLGDSILSRKGERVPFDDLVAKYKTPKRLLTEKRLKFGCCFSIFVIINNYIKKYPFLKYREIDFKVPAIYIGSLDVGQNVADTFLKMDKFTKVCYLNQLIILKIQNNI